SKVNIKKDAVFEVEENKDLKDILDKLKEDSEGVLNLNGDISKIDDKYKDFSKLYLGATKDITINEISNKIETLNLDPSNITMNLKGIDKATKLSRVNIGTVQNKGTVNI
ncbi:hypothetical protein, partial [Streptobacillus moniliformis]|uniref:hypothetical protein n=1 Tax=Streptobacillus moniliformis TaxID=34105 RepID=UPI000AA90A4A